MMLLVNDMDAEFLSERRFHLDRKIEASASVTTGCHPLGEGHLSQVDRSVHVAKRLGRIGIGIEWNAEYVDLAERRIASGATP